MPIAPTVLLLATLGLPASGYALQSPDSAPPAQNAAPAAAAAVPSSLLQPALDTVLQTVGALKLDKWKNGSVRTEATANVDSIQQDLQSTLPSLLHEADAAPGTVSKLLPVMRNIDALYDVLLRVFEAARVVAPGDQTVPLQQATEGLEKARRAFGNHLQSAAAAQEKQVGDLQATLKAQATPVCPVAPPPPPAPAKPAPAHKTVKKKAKPPAAKTPQGTNAQPAQPAPAAKPQQ